MIKDITINLSGPICFCKTQKLAWNIANLYIGLMSDPELTVNCDTCGTEITVPTRSLLANFNLDIEYPEGISEQKEARILKLVPKEKDQ